MLAFIAIFMSSVSGLIIREKNSLKNDSISFIKSYFLLTVLSNSLTIVVVRIIYGHLYTVDIVNSINGNATFFIKYCLCNLVFSAGCVLALDLFNKVVKIKLVEDKNEKK